jgi:hypothetical protein
MILVANARPAAALGLDTGGNGLPRSRRGVSGRGHVPAWDIWPPGPIVSAVRAIGEEAVRDALTEGDRPLMTASGGVRFEDEYRYLIAGN